MTDFPASPSVGQQVTFSLKTYEWNGTRWISVGAELNASNLVTGTVAIARGGTGSATAPMVGVITAADATAARTALGAAASNHSHTLGNITDAGTAAALDAGITSNDVLQVATSGVTANEFLRLEALGTKVISRTAAETLSDIGASPVAGSSSIVTTGTIASGTWNATAIEDTKLDLRVDHGVTFDGQGSVIETAKTVYVPVERNGVIKSATLVGDASGSATITVTKYDPAADDVDLGSPAAVGSIALATKMINRDTTLSGWTTAVSEGDILAFTTGGTLATVTRLTCKLKMELA